MNGQVIILNGVSSAGKTPLAKAIQKRADEIWLRVAMDDFIATLPDGKEFDREWFPIAEIEREGVALPQIGNGPKGDALLAQMRGLVESLAERGFNVVVDEVADEPVMADYKRRLNASRFIVKVDAPLSELERRERARGDRLIGLAREQSERIHQDIRYDLEVDTHTATPDDLARLVLAAAGA